MEPFESIAGHRFAADMDPATVEAFAKFAVAADVDHDGRDELIIAIDQAGENRPLFWAMDYDPVTRTWAHLCGQVVLAAPSNPDFACSSAAFAARFAFAADVDGDGRAESSLPHRRKARWATVFG